MTDAPIVVHLLDHRLETAPLRALLVRDAASRLAGFAHVEAAIGEGPGSGLPRLARSPSPSARWNRRWLHEAQRIAPVAAIVAWSVEAGCSIAGRAFERVPRTVLLDRLPTRFEAWRLRRWASSGLEIAAWDAWLEALPPALRWRLEPVRPVPVEPGEAMAQAVLDSVRSRPKRRAELELDPTGLAMGLWVAGPSAVHGRSARRDGFNIAALSVLSLAIREFVVDESELSKEGVSTLIAETGVAPSVRVAPLRSDPASWIGALDAAFIVGGPVERDADAALLPWMARWAGVPLFAMDQRPWSTLLRGTRDTLVPCEPPPRSATALLDAIREGRLRRSDAQAGERSTGRFADALAGAWASRSSSKSRRAAS
ncbi:MAG: hypothetical protein ACO3Y3_06260 [Phycisphaerales bacterium]|jgi:hypothetical protein